MLPVFCPTNHQTSHSRVCSNTIRYLFKRSFIHGDKILYFYPTQDLFPDQLFLCHVDIYSDDRVSKDHHHLRYLCVSDRECNPGCSGSPRQSRAPLHRSRTSVSAASNKGNHSLRREALLTGRSSTEPSKRGRDLLTLHKMSDIFLSCLCFLLDLLTNTLQQVYPQTCGREAQKQHLSSGFILCSISAVDL